MWQFAILVAVSTPSENGQMALCTQLVAEVPGLRDVVLA